MRSTSPPSKDDEAIWEKGHLGFKLCHCKLLFLLLMKSLIRGKVAFESVIVAIKHSKKSIHSIGWPVIVIMSVAQENQFRQLLHG